MPAEVVTPTPGVAPGTVFVTELMPNPKAVSDTAGEWFELYNSSPDVWVDINGWTTRDLGSNIHVISVGGPLVIPPLGYVVLGRNGDLATNGGITVDYSTAASPLETLTTRPCWWTLEARSQTAWSTSPLLCPMELRLP